MPVQASEEFKERLHAIRDDVYELNMYWLTFTGLFWNDDDPSELYTNTAPTVLHYLREAVLDVIILATARLCDPAATGKYANLNLRSIAAEPALAPIAANLNGRLAGLEPHFEPVKLWRKKRIAHTDAGTRVGYSPLPDLPYSQLGTLIREISNFANIIHEFVDGFTHGFSDPGYLGGPGRLIYFLRKGYEAHLQERRLAEM